MVCIWQSEYPPRRRNPRTSNRKFLIHFRLYKRRKLGPDKIDHRLTAAPPQIHRRLVFLEGRPKKIFSKNC